MQVAGLLTAQDYATAHPFPSSILDSPFLPAELLDDAMAQAEAVARAEVGIVYDNPLERKFVSGPADWARHGLTDTHSPLGEIVERFSSQDWLEFLQAFTGISGLRSDPSLYGAGLSVVKRGGMLALHRDLQLQPESNLERRVNLAIFLNKEWDDEWGGHLEFWTACQGKPGVCARRIRPKFGRIVLFDPDGFHGFPEPITCPPDKYRLTMQLFYYTAPRQPHGRTKARFTLRPGEDPDDAINQFRSVVSSRHLGSPEGNGRECQ